MVIKPRPYHNRRHGPSCLFVLLIAVVSFLSGVVLVKADQLRAWLIPPPTPTATPSAVAYAAVAARLAEEGQIAKAVVSYEAAIELDPANLSYYQSLIQLLLNHDPARAAEWARKATSQDPESGALWTLLASAQLIHGQRLEEVGQAVAAEAAYADAAEAARRAVELDPEDASAYAYLAGALARSADYLAYPKAQALAERAVSLDPANAETHRQLATALAAQGEYSEAILHYHVALDRAPERPELYLELAYLYFFTADRRQEAILLAQQAIEQDQEHAAAYDALGYFYFLIGDYLQAEENARQAVALDPELLRAHAHLGAALFRQEAYDEAIDALEQAIDAYGEATLENAAYFNMLGLAYARENPARCSQAVPLFNDVLAIAPPDSVTALNAREGLSLCQ